MAALSPSVEKEYVSKAKIIKMENRLTGTVELESLSPLKSKPIIDEIDRVLAKHYGFTDKELDFIIINYDIKYRNGGADAMVDEPSRLVGTRRDASSTLGAEQDG